MTIDEVFQFLVKAGSAAPSADNMQPCFFAREGDDLVLRYRAMGGERALFDSGHPATLIAMGAVVENLSQACTHLGLLEAMQTGQAGITSGEFCRIRLREAPAGQAAVLPLFARHTNRFGYRKTRLPVSLKESISSQSQGDASVRWIESSAVIGEIGKLVERASRVRFQTREIHDWFSNSLRFTREQVLSGDGLDVATFDLPPGGKLLLKAITARWSNMALFNAVGGYRFLASLEASSINKAGAVLAILAPGTAQGGLDAGRVMERIWIALNAAGCGVQPYYVVSDQIIRLERDRVPLAHRDAISALKAGLQTAIPDRGVGTVHMFLRVGEPLKCATLARRLPIAARSIG